MRGFSSPARWTPTAQGLTEGGERPAGRLSTGGWAGQQWSGRGPREFLASATAEQTEEKSHRPVKCCRTGTTARGAMTHNNLGAPGQNRAHHGRSGDSGNGNGTSQAFQPTGSPSWACDPHSYTVPRVEGPTPGVTLCCHGLEIFNTFLIRIMFTVHTGPLQIVQLVLPTKVRLRAK